MSRTTLVTLALFAAWTALSYFAVGYLVEQAIMSAGRAAALSLIGYFVIQLIVGKITRKA